MSKKQQYGEQMPLVAWLAIDTRKICNLLLQARNRARRHILQKRKKKLRPICFCFIF